MIIRLFLFFSLFQFHGNALYGSNDHAKLKRGYKALGITWQDDSDYYDSEIFQEDVICLLPKDIDSMGRIKISRPIRITQIPRYKESTGAFMKYQRRSQLNDSDDRECHWYPYSQDDYEKVEAIIAGNIDKNTKFPIQIDIGDRYVHPMMREKILLRPKLKWVTAAEKLKMDNKAGYALLSWQQQLHYTLFGGQLPDPYASHEQER